MNFYLKVDQPELEKVVDTTTSQGPQLQVQSVTQRDYYKVRYRTCTVVVGYHSIITRLIRLLSAFHMQALYGRVPRELSFTLTLPC